MRGQAERRETAREQPFDACQPNGARRAYYEEGGKGEAFMSPERVLRRFDLAEGAPLLSQAFPQVKRHDRRRHNEFHVCAVGAAVALQS